MSGSIRHSIALIFCSIILILQGGFYLIHEHSLEVLAHKCVHDGHHDFSFSEDCETCEIHANQNFIPHLEIQIVPESFVESLDDIYKSIELESKLVLHGQRGPPLKA